MASEIIFSTIDEEFPAAGQDNDTQGFRDNFSIIKAALAKASIEIGTLQNNTAGLELSEIEGGSDFNENLISNATLKGNIESLVSQGSRTGSVELNFGNGNYQVVKVEGGNIDFNVVGFPQEGAAKITLELFGDGTARTVTFSTTDAGLVTFKKSSGFPGTLQVTSADNPVLIEIYTRKKNADPGLLPRIIFLNYLGQFA